LPVAYNYNKTGGINGIKITGINTEQHNRYREAEPSRRCSSGVVGGCD